MSTVHWKSPSSKPHVLSRSLQVDAVGVVTFNEVLLCKDDTMAASVLETKAEDCPLDLHRPYVKGTSADRVDGGMWQVTRDFTALLDEDLIGELKLYKCRTTANREPIQTHPGFKTFAGKWGAEVNGAVFDGAGNGDFVRFKPFITEGETITVDGELAAATEDSKNRKCGISDFLSPIVHFEETVLVLEEDLAAKIEGELGFIATTLPNTLMRPHWPQRTWLLSKADPEWVAEGTYRLVREWALSGPRGWDVDIYPK